MVFSYKYLKIRNKKLMKNFIKTYEFEQLGFVAEKYDIDIFLTLISAVRIYLFLLHRGVIEPYVGPLINIKRLKERISELKP